MTNVANIKTAVRELAIDTVELLTELGCVAIHLDRVGSHYRITAIGDPLLSCATDETLKAKLCRLASERELSPALLLDYQFPPHCDPSTEPYCTPRYLIDWRLA